MNVVAIVQARLSSSRLPQKVLKNLDGKPVLKHVIDQLQSTKMINSVVVATTTEQTDKELVDWCLENQIKCYRGPLEDVLERFYIGAKNYSADIIVRVTSDNPLVDPDVIDEVVKSLIEEKADYASNNLRKTYPHGLDVEVISFQALETAYKCAKEKFEREHVTQYIRHRPTVFKLKSVELDQNYHDIRLTLDEKEDFEAIEIVMKLLGKDLDLKSLLQLFETYPSLKKINQGSKERHLIYNNDQGII